MTIVSPAFVQIHAGVSRERLIYCIMFFQPVSPPSSSDYVLLACVFLLLPLSPFLSDSSRWPGTPSKTGRVQTLERLGKPIEVNDMVSGGIQRSTTAEGGANELQGFQ